LSQSTRELIHKNFFSEAAGALQTNKIAKDVAVEKAAQGFEWTLPKTAHEMKFLPKMKQQPL
jgi:hypothetical protein